jgi:hypothetical protein
VILCVHVCSHHVSILEALTPAFTVPPACTLLLFPSVCRMSTPIAILLVLCSGYLHAVRSEQSCDFISRAQNPLKTVGPCEALLPPSPIILPSRNFPSASNTSFATVSTWFKPPKCLRCKSSRPKNICVPHRGSQACWPYLLSGRTRTGKLFKRGNPRPQCASGDLNSSKYFNIYCLDASVRVPHPGIILDPALSSRNSKNLCFISALLSSQGP